MKYIYQIGRLESRMQALKFSVDGKEFECELSSIALKNYLNSNTKLILIYPISLPFNKYLLDPKSNLDENFKNKIKEVLDNREAYFSNPFELFKLHPHTAYADDFLLIHSLGNYEEESFGGNFEDIVLEIFVDLVERDIKEAITELYVDISSGHNIYVSAMLEAVRHFSIFHGLSNWGLQNFKVKIIFSDPIIGSSKQNFDIHKDHELVFKIFFSSPISREDLEFKLARRIAEENRPFKREINNMLEFFSLCYSALKHNTPLVLYSCEFHSESQIKNLLLEVISHMKKRLHKNWKNSPNLEKNDYLKLILSLSFYKGMIRMMSQHDISLRDGVNINEIEKVFKKMYEVFGLDLNIELLGHELSILRKTISDKMKLTNEISTNWQPLSNIILGEGTFHKRNFIAHAGFERTVTEIKKENGKIYFRYKANEVDRIRKKLTESF